MKTRAQVIASHCVITRIPVEIITQIFKLIPSDLRAVSGTCRYLRAIASPLLYQEMSVNPTKRASFAPLDALSGKGRKERADLLRILRIQDFADPREQPPAHRVASFSTVIVSSLAFLSNLSSLSLPFPLLTNAVFETVHRHPSITTLSIVGEARGFAFPSQRLDVDSRVSLPPRSSVLTVPKISTELGLEGPMLLKSLATFLLFHSVAVPSMAVGFASPFPPHSPVLDYPLLPHLTTLTLLVLPDAFEMAVGFLETVIATQPSLRYITLRFTEVVGGFPLNHDSWVSFIDGEAYQPLPSFGEAWEGVKLRYVDTDFSRMDSDGDFIGDSVELGFFPNTTITPVRAQQLATQTSCADSISLVGDDLRWSDWTAVVEALASKVEYLQNIILICSTTSTPTVTTTLACSPSCYSKLAASHPSLHAASELIGGHLEVWKLSYDLNIARLNQLASLFQRYGGAVFWELSVKGRGQVVDFTRSVSKDGEWLTGKENVKLSTEEKVKRCRRFGCGDVKEGEDPISALKECGVDEVRAALVVGAFDLDAFDARPASLPIKANSFETFLRSNSQTDDGNVEDST